MRLKNLITGTFALVVAALGLMITVALALFLVLPGGTGFLPILIAGLGIFSHLVFGFIRSWVTSTFAHLRAIRARAGIFYDWSASCCFSTVLYNQCGWFLQDLLVCYGQ